VNLRAASLSNNLSARCPTSLASRVNSLAAPVAKTIVPFSSTSNRRSALANAKPSRRAGLTTIIPPGEGACQIRLRELLSAGAFANSRAERTEKGAGYGVVAPLPFRVPLHGEQEPARAGHGNGLDEAIWSGGFGEQRRREPVDALAVQRVHAKGLFREQLRQQAAVADADIVGGTILHVEFGFLVFAMIHASGHLLHMLVQRAAHHDIQFLKAAADAEGGDAFFDGGLQKRKSRVVALFVEPGAFARGFSVVARGRDVRRRACEEKTIDGGKDFRGRDRRIKRRDEQRQGLRAVAHGGDVFLAHRMKGVRADHAVIADDTDDGNRRAHGFFASTYWNSLSGKSLTGCTSRRATVVERPSSSITVHCRNSTGALTNTRVTL